MIPFIPPQWQFLAKFIITLVIAGAAAATAWHLTAEHYQAIIARNDKQISDLVNAQLLRNQAIRDERDKANKLAEEQHAKDQLAINNLGAELRRVRIHIPTCPSSVPGTDQTGTDPDGAARLLSERVDAAFARLQAGIGQLAQRCDQLNIDAIAANKRNQ